jgi:hypothetical protein
MTKHDYKTYMKDRQIIIKINRKLARLGYPLLVVPYKVKAPKPVSKIGWLDFYSNLKHQNLSEVN